MAPYYATADPFWLAEFVYYLSLVQAAQRFGRRNGAATGKYGEARSDRDESRFYGRMFYHFPATKSPSSTCFMV
jgi:hypothetical protein